MCVVIFHNLWKAAAILSWTFSGAGWHLTTVSGHRQQHGPMNIPGCSWHPAIAQWCPPQRGRVSQSHSCSEVRGREKQPHLRQNSGGRYCLGLGHRLCRSEEWTGMEDKDGTVIADREEQSSNTRDWVAVWCHFHQEPTYNHRHLGALQQSTPVS